MLGVFSVSGFDNLRPNPADVFANGHNVGP